MDSSTFPWWLTYQRELVLMIILVYVFGSAAMTCWLASEKGYKDYIWFILGLLLGIIALLALVGAPPKTEIIKEQPVTNYEREYWAAVRRGERPPNF